MDGTEGTGDWYAAFRTIILENADWVRGVELTTALAQCRIKAQAVDDHNTRGALQDLRLAAERLERLCDVYTRRVEALKQEVEAFAAAVQAEYEVHVDQPPTANGIPLEDELLERMSGLYGLAKPKPRR